jgi:superfamily II DNA or RNA helicase
MSTFFNKSKNTITNKIEQKKINDEIGQMPQNLNTYLGQKGYTILKSELPIAKQLYIKEKLMIKPFVMGSPVQVEKTYPAYRESDKKLYVPRYFGEKIFGPPKEIKITEGTNINLTFNGSLRENQIPVVEKYLDHIKNGGGGLLELPCGFGKTIIASHLISRINKKTLVIVHKEFLLNQWIERINEFLPGAKIGKIQGQVIDIDNKDIVICMLQSLSMKDYPSSLFDSFGFTIIDEVHHISSEVFSCALFKMVTKYMLGLSATMNRRDGTSNVFKMFLGDIVYKSERSKDEEVTVRGIIYRNDNDEEYNNVEMDFRGKVCLAKMIGKITEYSHRSEFILKVLKDMLEENPKQQIMMLSQYKNILSYMYDAIKHRNIASVGYYIGGMKESALKESETKQIVLATFSMAAEGLDIKSLTTLVMITPMTNIEQSVGRILRQKHNFEPIVVDIIDSHENFQRQWQKRKSFYKKQNYRIIQTDSIKYNSNTNSSSWKIISEPKNRNKLTKNINNCILDINSDSDSNSNNEVDIDSELSSVNTVSKCLLKFKK